MTTERGKTQPIPVDPIARLLAATPWPPETEDMGELLAAASTMLAARSQVLEELVGAKLERIPGGAELLIRQQAWDTRLAAARDELAAQRIGLARARRGYR